jgi:hypothetical protein
MNLKKDHILDAEAFSKQLLTTESLYLVHELAPPPPMASQEASPAPPGFDFSASLTTDHSFSSNPPEEMPGLTVDPSQLMNTNQSSKYDEVFSPPILEQLDCLLGDLASIDPEVEQYDFQQSMLFDAGYWMDIELTGQKITSESLSSETLRICHVYGCNYMSFSLSHYR